MTPAEIVARMFAAYENGGTMTESEFVKAVLAKYEVCEDVNEPTPSFEVVLEWIARDRMEARDEVEWRWRCQQAEDEVRKYQPCKDDSGPCWYDGRHELRHEATVYHKVQP